MAMEKKLLKDLRIGDVVWSREVDYETYDNTPKFLVVGFDGGPGSSEIILFEPLNRMARHMFFTDKDGLIPFFRDASTYFYLEQQKNFYVKKQLRRINML